MLINVGVPIIDGYLHVLTWGCLLSMGTYLHGGAYYRWVLINVGVPIIDGYLLTWGFLLSMGTY